MQAAEDQCEYSEALPGYVAWFADSTTNDVKKLTDLEKKALEISPMIEDTAMKWLEMHWNKHKPALSAGSSFSNCG